MEGTEEDGRGSGNRREVGSRGSVKEEEAGGIGR